MPNAVVRTGYCARLVLAVLAVIALFDVRAGAQFRMSGPEVTYEAITETDKVHPGTETRIAIEIALSEGWHVNSNTPLEEFLIPTELSLGEAPGVTVERVVYPEHEVLRLGSLPNPVALYEERFTLGAVATIAQDAAPGTVTLTGALRYQACNDKICAPPKTIDIEVPIDIAPADAALTPQKPELFAGLSWAAESGESNQSNELEAGGEEVAASAGGDWRALAENFQVANRIGYASTGEFLQFIEDAETGAGATDDNFFAGKSIWLVLGLVLVGGLALNLTPCVLPLIPINIAIIGAGAQAGSRARGFALGGAYGVGIAAVYGALGLVVVLGLSTAFGAINATVWFNAGIAIFFLVLGLAMFDIIAIDFSKYQAKLGIRKNENGSFFVALGMGALSALLAGACVAPVVIYTILYAQELYANGSTIALALPFLLGVGMALPWPFAGASLSFLPKPGKWMTYVKYAFGVFIIGFAVYYGHLAYTIGTAGVESGTVAAETTGKDGWETDLATALEKADAQDKPVFVDFWATWCKNCLVMDKTVLKEEAVLDALEGYVKLKYQAEDPSRSPAKDVMAYYDVLGLPAYVILQPKSGS